MLTFLKLFVLCTMVGILASSLMWVLFWVVGVFELPQSVQKRFEGSPQLRGRAIERTVLVNLVNTGSQAGTVRIVFPCQNENAFIELPQQVNSASSSKFKGFLIPSDKENMANATH
jgi:hypothetical protein